MFYNTHDLLACDHIKNYLCDHKTTDKMREIIKLYEEKVFTLKVQRNWASVLLTLETILLVWIINAN